MRGRSFVTAAWAALFALVTAALGYIFLGPSGGRADGARVFESLAPTAAKSLIETRADLRVIDVRTPEEFRRGALPGSRLIPFWEFTKGRYDLPKDRPILLVCAVGGRSLAVGQLLSAQGYREVYNLRGGLEAWVEQRVPLPVRNGG